MCKRLKKGDLFSKRIASCQLYAHVYDRLNEDNRSKVREKYAKLVKDDTPMVRRGAAQSIATLAGKIEPEMAPNFLLPHLEGLLDDINDSVKVYALQSAIPLSNRLSEQKVQEHIVPPLKAAQKNKGSWRLRFSVAESAAFIAKNMGQNAVNTDIVPLYVSLLGDSEAEVRSEASSKLVELAGHCSVAMIV